MAEEPLVGPEPDAAGLDSDQADDPYDDEASLRLAENGLTWWEAEGWHHPSPVDPQLWGSIYDPDWRNT